MRQIFKFLIASKPKNNYGSKQKSIKKF